MAVESPPRAEVVRPGPGDPATRAEELIIKEARRRHRRRVATRAGVVALTIVGLAIGVAVLVGHRSSGTRPPPSLARPGHLEATATRCQSGQLKITSLRGGSGLGQTEEVIGFLNESRAACTLVGYPVVVALDAHGAPAATAQPALSWFGGDHAGPTTPPTVTLRPGQTASATIEGESHPTGSATSCPSYPSFRVTPPGGTVSVTVSSWSGWSPGPFPGCQPIAITPVVPGGSGHFPATASPVRTLTPSISGSPPATIPSHDGSATTSTTP